VDQCTRWIECIPLKKLTAIETCTALGKFFYSIGNIPRVIVSNIGTNFVASLTKELYSFFEIELRNSTPLHPTGNGIAERKVGTVKESLKHVTASFDGNNWDLYLPKILWSLKSAVNETTGHSPFKLMYGRVGRRTLDVLKENWSNDGSETVMLNKSSRNYLDRLDYLECSMWEEKKSVCRTVQIKIYT